MVLADASHLILMSFLAIFSSQGSGEDWNKCEGTSCLGRCGQTYEAGGGFKCSCDELCPLFRDCCRDFYSECQHAQLPSFIYNHGHFKCLKTVDYQPSAAQMTMTASYGISACPDSYPKGDTYGFLCSYIDDPSSRAYKGKVIFQNAYCKICWEAFGEDDIYKHLTANIRPCIPNLKDCKPESEKMKTSLELQACQSYQYPVVHIKDGQATSYKNGDCAACDLSNQDWINNTFCHHYDYSGLLRTGGIGFSGVIDKNATQKEFQETMIKNTFKYTPESISILINFGFVDKHFLYYAENSEHNCQPYEIWDPFSQLCRAIYCSSRFDLGHLSCVDLASNGSSSNLLEPNPVPISSKVQLDLRVYIKVGNASVENVTAKLFKHFGKAFADTMMISHNRIGNISVSYIGNKTFSTRREILLQIYNASVILQNEGYWPNIDDPLLNEEEFDAMVKEIECSNIVHELEISFSLGDSSQVETSLMTTDSVAALCAEMIGLDSLIVNVEDMLVRIVSIHESTVAEKSDLIEWCRGGRLTTYLQHEFNVSFVGDSDDGYSLGKFDNWTIKVYVETSGKWYEAGEFVANILLQGMIHSSDANMTGFIMTCEDRAHLNESCGVYTSFALQDFNWPSDPSLPPIITYMGSPKFGISNPLYPWQYVVISSRVFVCLTGLPILPTNGTLAILSSVLLIASVIGLYLTIVTHLIFSELRNLPGLNLLSMNCCMVMYQQIFLLGITQESADLRLCKAVAVVLHYLILATFFWTNVMAWDLYQTFGKRAVFSQIRSRKYWKKYALYAFGIPLLLVSVSFSLDFMDVFTMDYGIYNCWIGDIFGSLVFFAAPIIYVLLTNIIMYTKTILSIRYVAKKLKTDGGMSSQKNRGRTDFFIYIRMFFILSFNWIFGILTLAIPEDSEMPWLLKLQQILVFLFVIFTGANGMVICFIFTMNRRILELHRQLFCRYFKVTTILRPIKTWKRDRKISAQSKISTLTQTTYY